MDTHEILDFVASRFYSSEDDFDYTYRPASTQLLGIRSGLPLVGTHIPTDLEGTFQPMVGSDFGEFVADSGAKFTVLKSEFKIVSK